MSLAELTFDCSSLAIEGNRYGSTRVVAGSVDVDDLMSQIRAGGELDYALNSVGKGYVIAWLEENGYAVTSNDEAA